MKKIIISIMLLFSQIAFGAVELTNDNIDTTVRASLLKKRPVVIQVYAVWCGPCKMMAPVMAQVERKLSDQVDFYRLNIDTVAGFDFIQSVPTTLIINRKGELQQPLRGYNPSPVLVEADILKRIN